MASVGIKRLTIDNVTIQVKTGTAEYLPSGSEKTPVLDDGTGDVMFTTVEKKAGMIKAEVSTLKSADTHRLRNVEDSEMVLELVDGTTVVGSSMTQTANNPITTADGIAPYEFMGNVKVR